MFVLKRFALKLLLLAFWVRNSWGYEYYSFQNITVCSTNHTPGYPSNIQDIQFIVRYAIARNVSVKPIGSLHSATDIICTDGIPLIMHKIKHIQYDHVTEQVRVGGGCTVKELTEYLHKNGRALQGLPAFGGITVAGAVGTGAHGSSLTRPSTLSDQMVGVTFVDGLGAIVKVNTSDPHLLSAFKAHLGLLGIIYEVTLETLPQFKIHFSNYPMPADMILTQISKVTEVALSRDYFHFWWFPTTQRVVVAEGSVVPSDAEGECQTNLIPDVSLGSALATRYLWASRDDLRHVLLELYSRAYYYRKVAGQIPMYSTVNQTGCPITTGYSHKMLSNTCEQCLWDHGEDSLSFKEFSIIIPLEELESAVGTIKQILDAHPAPFSVGGLFFRFITPSDGLLSMNKYRNSVSIEWEVLDPPERFRQAAAGIASRQSIQQALINKHQGRAHWGKNGLYFSSPEMIQLQHGQHHKRFVMYMERLDPQGVFLNPFGRRVRFGSPDYIPNSRIKHCALHDNCLCTSHSDCGDGKKLNLDCGRISNYPVCVEQLPAIARIWKRITQAIIKNLVPLESLLNWQL